MSFADTIVSVNDTIPRVNLSSPLESLLKRTDAAVLTVLSRTDERLTGRQVARLANSSTPANVRLSLLRLADVGVVTVMPRSDAVLYSANREHLLWPAIQIALDAETRLIERIRAMTLRHGFTTFTTVVLYGSIARGDGDSDSDVDLLVVQAREGALREAYLDYLREDVRKWTGNRVQIFDASPAELRSLKESGDPLFANWMREGRLVVGDPLETLVGDA